MPHCSSTLIGQAWPHPFYSPPHYIISSPLTLGCFLTFSPTQILTIHGYHFKGVVPGGTREDGFVSLCSTGLCTLSVFKLLVKNSFFFLATYRLIYDERLSCDTSCRATHWHEAVVIQLVVMIENHVNCGACNNNTTDWRVVERSMQFLST